MKTAAMWHALVAMLALAGANQPAAAQEALQEEILALKQSWAEANYHIAEKPRRAAAMEALQARAHELSAKYPQRAEPLIWEGIVYSSYADARGGLGALGAAKKARALFEQAIAIDERALEGSALGSLGVLYAKVPGFPVGFGDRRKAQALLEKAVAVSPDGIDSNYFLGEFLIDHDQREAGIRHLQKSVAAPDRPGQEVADRGRREQARALLAKNRGS